MKRNIVVYRFQMNPTFNRNAAEALRGFYEQDPQRAFAIPTPYGMVSNMITPATAEQIFDKLSSANIGNHFIVIELDAEGNPIKTLTSVGDNLSVGESVQTRGAVTDHSLVDSMMTEQQLENEFNSLLEKVGATGLDSLSPAERARLDHLSQR